MTTISKYSCTRRIELDAAHRVPDHKSKCFAIHGHRYVVEATCSGLLHASGSETGMVIDFGFLKEDMMNVIHEPFDHGIILHDKDPVATMLLDQALVLGPEIRGCWLKIYLLQAVPTAENLAKHWYQLLASVIEDQYTHAAVHPKLEYLDVWETPNCHARYPFNG